MAVVFILGSHWLCTVPPAPPLCIVTTLSFRQGLIFYGGVEDYYFRGKSGASGVVFSTISL